VTGSAWPQKGSLTPSRVHVPVVRIEALLRGRYRLDILGGPRGIGLVCGVRVVAEEARRTDAAIP
jgi:hypothetical protein